jgi:hypothetical protein
MDPNPESMHLDPQHCYEGQVYVKKYKILGYACYDSKNRITERKKISEGSTIGTFYFLDGTVGSVV